MIRSRKFLTVGALSVGAMALIGAGAGATFTDSVHATQQIQAGTLNMTVTGPNGSTTNGKTVTLAALGPVNSEFTTGAQEVVTTNSGDITANSITLSASDTNNNATLKSEVYVKIESWSGPNKTGTLATAYDGPLSGLEGAPMAITGPIAKGQTDPFDVTFYADAAHSLTNPAEGGVVIPSITVAYTG